MNNFKFTEDHEWVKVDGDIAYVGISAHAAEQLGDIVFLEVNTVGETLSKGEVFATIEAVKAASDIYLPISGEILEANENLLEGDNCKIINTDAYNEGWIAKIKPTDLSELDNLMTAEEYKNYIA